MNGRVAAVRTLFLTIDPPYPPSSGAPLRNWQNVSLAAKLGPVAVVSIGHDPAEAAEIPNVARWEHVIVPRAANGATRGYPALSGETAAGVRPVVAEVAQAFAPTVTVLENFWLDGVRDVAGLGTVVLDSHNVYVSVAEELGLDVDYVRARERDVIAASDGLWVCSADDADRMRAEYAPRIPIAVVPNGIDVSYYAPIRSGRSRRLGRVPSVLFVGSFWYEPNRIAAERLAHEIVPRVRERLGADVRLYLVGAAPSPAMLAAAEDKRTVVTGRVPDVRPYLTLADLIVVPLQHGGGTRLKLLEAFAAERAVVASAKAAEGLAVRDGEQLLLRESTEETVEAVCALLQDRERAAVLARAAYAFVDATYSWEALEPVVHGALGEAASAPAERKG